MSSPARRVRENATGIVSMVVTGIWLAALFLDQGWWLAFMLFGYVVLVPVTAIRFDDESEMERWWDRETGEAGAEKTAEKSDALEELRSRYARGELTDEQFERKLDRLLEAESLEDVEDEKHRARELERE